MALLLAGSLWSAGCKDDRSHESKNEHGSMKEHGLAAEVTNSSDRRPGAMRPSQANDTTGKRIGTEADFVASPETKLRGQAKLKEVAGGVRID